MRHVALVAIFVFVSAGAFSQSHYQPYSEFRSRTIKALSEQQIADLRAGRGMSLALAAELNGYPGPLHAIEHANALALTPPQLSRMQHLFDEMKREAVALGERLISQEAELDRSFAAKSVTSQTLVDTVTEIGKTQAELRATHLRYHLLAVEVLTPDQLQHYARLRGYSGSPEDLHRGHPHQR